MFWNSEKQVVGEDSRHAIKRQNLCQKSTELLELLLIGYVNFVTLTLFL